VIRRNRRVDLDVLNVADNRVCEGLRLSAQYPDVAERNLLTICAPSANIPDCMDCFFRATNVPVITVPFPPLGRHHLRHASGKRATFHCRQKAGWPGSFRLSFAPGSGIAAVHGVVVHFVVVPPPIVTLSVTSACLVGVDGEVFRGDLLLTSTAMAD
jgi:hypothetical protein